MKPNPNPDSYLHTLNINTQTLLMNAKGKMAKNNLPEK